MKYLLLIFTTFLITSCVSTKSTLKNVDNNAKRPSFTDNRYVITEYAENNKYGFDPDYPVNIGFIHEKQETINIEYYFNGLEGPNGEKISFRKVDTCCPFPTKNTNMGAGTIGIYEVTFEGTTKKITMYFNIFEKGKIVCPKGFSIKKLTTRDK
ncbi:2-dehydro-3-deoxyphosphooctonate aldolase [Flavobacterium sp. LMO8]|uniref:2-dehydro-3-deoxyphosphooctonate aldolase n=1 Tax=Flavobacterium sp. LMO8 TaxID=2654244 RepID=UPI001291B071|nr:2-dehydro-3-deoxyphosphooctonate aldolase [Flavobacterium sp. LMO8]MQP25721.1 2-dehydro-3-deoxyphosphooctonate aldolase [Flavobacterium sp. LMO8]